MDGRNKKLILIIASVLFVGGAITFLARESMGDAEYYVHVDEVVKDPTHWLGRRTLQIHGFARNVPLKPTLENQTVTRDFELESKGALIEVHHEGTVPDTFKEQAETVVKGTLTQGPDGKLLLTTVGGEPGIMAKCPSKYAGK